MRRGQLSACLAVVFVGLWAGSVPAQDAPAQDAAAQDAPATAAPPAAPTAALAGLLTLDEERLFSDSAFGKAALARQDAETRALIDENRRIEAGLEVEEKDLTTRRAAMSRDDFTPLSDAFNVKVEGIRKAQDAKTRDLGRKFDEDRRLFLQAVRPILADLMTARGAVAIIDKRAVFVGFENIDVTTEAIAELDKAFDEGRLTPAAP